MKTIKSFLFVSYTILIAGTIVLFGLALPGYQRAVRGVFLTSNRFLTTEWHLLQELKSRTDRQLRDKDIEIARLRAEYLDLKKRDYSADVLGEIERKLRKAEDERAVILSFKLSTTSPATVTDPRSVASLPDVPADSSGVPASGAELQAVAPGAVDRTMTEISESMNELLLRKIKTLEAEVAVHRLRAEMAEQKAATIANEAVPAPESLSSIPVPVPAHGRESSDEKIRMILDVLERKNAEISQEPPPKIEDIKTRSLLRAIVSSPEISKEYPGLLEDLDRYFSVYGRQEWLTGQKDAYGFMVETIKALESAKAE